MKVCKLISGLLVSLLFSAATIAADSKYPATDFQPKVLYQDADYKHSESSSSSSKSSAAVSEEDSNYPATNFEPKVLYQDKEYKPTKDSDTISSSGSYCRGCENDRLQAADEETSLGIILGLLTMTIVGFILYQKGSQSSSVRRTSPTVGADSSGLSGVAKYVANKVGLAPSGVSRYLENQESQQASGVEKYMTRQKISERMAATENVSGVEKYLQDRG